MGRFPQVKAREVTGALERLGFALARQKGSHAAFEHPDGRWTTVPIHPSKNFDPHLLREVLKQLQVSDEDFLEALRKRK